MSQDDTCQNSAQTPVWPVCHPKTFKPVVIYMCCVSPHLMSDPVTFSCHHHANREAPAQSTRV